MRPTVWGWCLHWFCFGTVLILFLIVIRGASESYAIFSDYNLSQYGGPIGIIGALVISVCMLATVGAWVAWLVGLPSRGDPGFLIVATGFAITWLAPVMFTQLKHNVSNSFADWLYDYRWVLGWIPIGIYIVMYFVFFIYDQWAYRRSAPQRVQL